MPDTPTATSQSTLPAPPKRRGRKLATGPFESRAELCEQVRWYYENTSMSVEAIGRRFEISQGAARKALDEALGVQPSS